MALDEKQSGVLRHLAPGGLVSIAVLGGAILWRPAFLVPLLPLYERLAAALRWDAVILLCLVVAIGNLARHRFFSPADIDGSGIASETDRARIYQAVLQNTLEQTVIAVFSHLLWAATMPVAWFPAVPAAALLFVVGRACFAAGYAGGAAARAFGFALTFYPTVILLCIAVAAMLWRLVGG